MQEEKCTAEKKFAKVGKRTKPDDTPEKDTDTEIKKKGS